VSGGHDSALALKLIDAENKIQELSQLLYRKERSAQEKEMKQTIKG
jgi:7-cyano-7-deazaguanine synthase in queuosine biosynthesis